MSSSGSELALAEELTRIVSGTPGVIRLYAPTRAVPLLGTAQKIFTDVTAHVPVIRVEVDAASSKVTASIGIDLSSPAAEIGAAVCTRITESLASAGWEMDVKITIAYVTG